MVESPVTPVGLNLANPAGTEPVSGKYLRDAPIDAAQPPQALEARRLVATQPLVAGKRSVGSREVRLRFVGPSEGEDAFTDLFAHESILLAGRPALLPEAPLKLQRFVDASERAKRPR